MGVYCSGREKLSMPTVTVNGHQHRLFNRSGRLAQFYKNKKPMSLKIFSAVAQTLVLGDSPRELNGPLRMPLGPGFNLVFPQQLAATNLLSWLVLLQDSRQSTVGSTHLFPGSILILLSWHSLAIFPTFYSLSPFHTCIPLLTSIPFLPLLLQLTLFHL